VVGRDTVPRERVIGAENDLTDAGFGGFMRRDECRERVELPRLRPRAATEPGREGKIDQPLGKRPQPRRLVPRADGQGAAIGAERYRRQRTHKPEQVKQIAASIREFGFTKRSGPVSLLGLVGAGIVRVRHKIGRAAQHDPVGICISGSSFFMGRKNYRREIRRAAETLRFQSDGREFFLKPGAVWAVFCPDVP
jgi:hypothetical protein